MGNQYYTYNGTVPHVPGTDPGYTPPREPKERNKYTRKSQTFDPTLCGTQVGWNQHERLEIPLCQACRDWLNGYRRELQRIRREKQMAAIHVMHNPPISDTELSTKLDSAGQKKTAPAVLPTLNSGA